MGLLASSINGSVTRRANTPTNGMTTYLVTLAKESQSTTTVMATVVLLDVALVDGSTLAIQPSVVPINATSSSTSSSSSGTEYEVVLELPPFNESLVYEDTRIQLKLFLFSALIN